MSTVEVPANCIGNNLVAEDVLIAHLRRQHLVFVSRSQVPPRQRLRRWQVALRLRVHL